MNILIVSHLYPSQADPVNGIFVQEQVNALRCHGFNVVIISPVPFVPIFFDRIKAKWRLYKDLPLVNDVDGVKTFRPRYICFRHIPMVFLSLFMLSAAKRAALAISKNFNFDLIHAHTSIPDGFIALKLGRYFNKPSVCTLHGSDINLYPWRDRICLFLTKKVIMGTDQLIAVSNFIKSQAERIARPNANIQVVYNGCDPRKFVFNNQTRISIRRRLNISDNSRVLIFVGNLLKAKGIFELVWSFAGLCKNHPSFSLIVVGDGDDQVKLKEAVQGCGLEKYVHLIGRVEHNKIPDFLSAGDIFVLPSHREGLPVSVIEAMACGRPVIATNVGGIPEIVRDQQTGLLIEPENVSSLTNAVMSLAFDMQRCIKMGDTGRKIVEEGFAWGKSAENLANIYRSVLKRADNDKQ